MDESLTGIERRGYPIEHDRVHVSMYNPIVTGIIPGGDEDRITLSNGHA